MRKNGYKSVDGVFRKSMIEFIRRALREKAEIPIEPLSFHIDKKSVDMPMRLFFVEIGVTPDGNNYSDDIKEFFELFSWINIGDIEFKPAYSTPRK